MDNKGFIKLWNKAESTDSLLAEYALQTGRQTTLLSLQQRASKLRRDGNDLKRFRQGRVADATVSDGQLDIFRYLVKHVQEFGFQPTVQEVAEHFGVAPRAIHDKLGQLARKGFITLSPKGDTRAIRLHFVRFEPVYTGPATKESGY